jgi:hypothetical protein
MSAANLKTRERPFVSFFIKLEKGVKERVTSWNLPPPLLNEILEHLYDSTLAKKGVASPVDFCP